ncbi:hypothetical protein F3Y22_tig00111806pilonHSYRG00070 [Hibiscus syriacus]|uniref:Uncharacterized protein n=1 Tax=Hibiscus syriacus TaxID=106335 RepID=A0A6A2XTM3_HIBSY|nr:hypothetical protein F3Y22_tig00111806pilonHSYRG00070 [Hibiscus syriacus]
MYMVFQLFTGFKRIGKTGSAEVEQGSAWKSRMEAYHLHLAASRSYSSARQHVELGLYWHTPRTTIRIRTCWAYLSVVWSRWEHAIGSFHSAYVTSPWFLSPLHAICRWNGCSSDHACGHHCHKLGSRDSSSCRQLCAYQRFLVRLLLGFVLLLPPQFGWGHKDLPAGAPLKSKHKSYQYVFCVIAAVSLIVGKLSKPPSY